MLAKSPPCFLVKSTTSMLIELRNNGVTCLLFIGCIIQLRISDQYNLKRNLKSYSGLSHYSIIKVYAIKLGRKKITVYQRLDDNNIMVIVCQQLFLFFLNFFKTLIFRSFTGIVT